MQEGKWNNSIITFFLGVFGIGNIGNADIGLIGGKENSDAAFAAFVDVPSGNLTPLSGLPTNGVIYSVGLNNSGSGIIGGSDFTSSPSNGYAALINVNGTVTPLTISATPGGIITAVSINQNGYALIGGNINGSFAYYAASVQPDGTVTPITLPISPLIRDIRAVSVNDARLGLIGGTADMDNPYAAYISPTGVETALTLPVPNMSSGITSVAINSLGNGIIGGAVNSAAYAALTTAGQTAVTPLSPLPPLNTTLYAVAINNAGLGLVGGFDNNNNAFAGYAAPDGTVTSLLTSPFSGNIFAVAINDFGQGIIGGTNNSNVYAALVTPSGAVTSLIDSPPSGVINSVAIDDSGIALFAGQVNLLGYAALVAPNGALTFLDASSLSTLNSAALESALNAFVEEITPTSIGFFNSVFFAQLAMSSALELRFLQQNKIWNSIFESPIAHSGSMQTDELLASNTSMLNGFDLKPESALPCRREPEKVKNAIWVAPFGDFFHLKARRSVPNIRNDVGGVLLGYDRQGDHFLVGTALGYAFNHVKYGKKQGHGNIQEEMGSVYGCYYANHFWLDAAVWGGFYQFSNDRRTMSHIKSKGKTHGQIFAPHLEMASPWAFDQQRRYFIEPFAAFDWVKSWQHSFTETGASGFNLKMKSFHGSLLQSEIGVRFYERFSYCWGDVQLEEKVSYVNQAPFFHKNVTTAFVGSAATFPIAIGSTKTENLACVGLMANFVPAKTSYPFGGFAAQVTANGSYQSYYVSVFGGWKF